MWRVVRRRRRQSLRPGRREGGGGRAPAHAGLRAAAGLLPSAPRGVLLKPCLLQKLVLAGFLADSSCSQHTRKGAHHARGVKVAPRAKCTHTARLTPMFERSTPGEDSSKHNSVGKLGRLRDGRGFAEAGRLLGRTQQAHDLLARLLLLRLQLGLQHTGEHRKKSERGIHKRAACQCAQTHSLPLFEQCRHQFLRHAV